MLLVWQRVKEIDEEEATVESKSGNIYTVKVSGTVDVLEARDALVGYEDVWGDVDFDEKPAELVAIKIGEW